MWRDFEDGPGRSRAARARTCGVARPPCNTFLQGLWYPRGNPYSGTVLSDTQKKMARVKVYRFKCSDVTPEKHLPAARWGTLEAIDTIERCIALKDTVTEVNEELLDAQGFLHGEPPG